MPESERRDTACPVTKDIKGRKRIEKYPDVIGIGVPKCGTGTLAFFDCHSKIVFRESEPIYFNTRRARKGLGAYAVPYASKDEILIEKSPEYSKGGRNELLARANEIKKQIPHARLLGE